MKEFRILILTQPLGSNIGGILQAYALQKKLKMLNYNTATDNHKIKNSIMRYYIKKLRHVLLNKLLGKTTGMPYTNTVLVILNTNTNTFIDNNIDTICVRKYLSTPRINTIKNIDAFIVGSDQVWRKAYSNIPEHLLDFTKDMDVKRISYAASFGKDDLSEYGPKLIKKSAILAKKFNAISVREDTGVDICKIYWGVDALQVVDPTLLLEKSDYNKLIKNDSKLLKPSSGKIFTYILDKDSNKQLIIDHVAKKLNQKTFDIMPPKPMSKKELKNNPEKYMLPHVTQWLKSFADAEFVITDSFHGCVFSIIYNKPFIAIGNKNRGLTRFTSLLKVFNLQNRLVTNLADTDVALCSEINWKNVNAIKAKEMKRAIEFLQSSINGSKDTKAKT